MKSAIFMLIIGAVFLANGCSGESAEPDKEVPVYHSAEAAAKGFVEEKNIWKSTAWITTKANEHILLAEDRENVFFVGAVTKEDGYRYHVLSARASYRGPDGEAVEGGGTFEWTEDHDMEEPYTLHISMDEDYKLPDSEYTFDLMNDKDESVIESVDFLKGLRQDEEDVNGR